MKKLKKRREANEKELEKDKINNKKRKKQKEKHIKKLKRIKNEMVKLNLDENNIDGWNIKQLKMRYF